MDDIEQGVYGDVTTVPADFYDAKYPNRQNVFLLSTPQRDEMSYVPTGLISAMAEGASSVIQQLLRPAPENKTRGLKILSIK